jgi:hypothetical protein
MKSSYEGEKSSSMLLKDIGLVQRKDEIDQGLQLIG